MNTDKKGAHIVLQTGQLPVLRDWYLESHKIAGSGLAPRRLGVIHIFFFTVAAAAPLTALGGGVTTTFAVTGVLGVPLSFILVGLALAFFAVGYAAMSRFVSNAGAFYTYVAQDSATRPGSARRSWRYSPTTRSRSASTACSARHSATSSRARAGPTFLGGCGGSPEWRSWPSSACFGSISTPPF